MLLSGRRWAGLPDRSAAGERLDLAALALDVKAVLDACEAGAAVLSGVRSGCSVAVRFAASYPARTQALVLAAGFAKMTRPGQRCALCGQCLHLYLGRLAVSSADPYAEEGAAHPDNLVRRGQIGKYQPPPHQRVRRRPAEDRLAMATAMSFMLLALRAIATAKETSAPHSVHSGNFAALRQREPSTAVNPPWSASDPGLLIAFFGLQRP